MNGYPIYADYETELAYRQEHGNELLARWPSALGLVVALFGAAAAPSRTLASVVAVCALVYVLAAVTGRRVAAWWGLVGAVPVLLADRLSGVPGTALLLLGLVGVVLVLVGRTRGTWSERQHAVQLYGLAAFGALAVAAALSGGILAAVLVAVGLLAHAAWDVAHLVLDRTVGRRYAELCAVLDTALALAVLWRVL